MLHCTNRQRAGINGMEYSYDCARCENCQANIAELRRQAEEIVKMRRMTELGITCREVVEFFELKGMLRFNRETDQYEWLGGDAVPRDEILKLLRGERR